MLRASSSVRGNNPQKTQYWTYLQRWVSFCCERQIDIFKATEIDVMEFLTMLYKARLGYSAINAAHSMLSSVISVDQFKTIGQWPLVKDLLKGSSISNHLYLGVKELGM